ncbi:MAG: proline--tRNA ligase, partial [Oscillospiraceae bacterium]|nr:proline--tRNA ligase [Oscillospiraceae bacterium]
MSEKKLVEAITARSEDFAKWYTDVVIKSQLVAYSGVRGCMYIHPYGTALWENIRTELDARFKATGHENVMLPLFIPESLLQKEKDHVEGFAPEVAWVTHGGSEKLQERLCVRPTSETLFCDYYASVIHSYRDLPKLYNQWANVVRWEKTTRPFLRTMEFFWQEGHTMHETADEAWEETERMLNVYADFAENALAIPVVKGRKTDKEKFAGAEATYTIEALMHDGQALQAGTSHYFGDGFARAFDITFNGRNNTLQYPHQTSWGMSTRIIGGIIMVHGDDSGLVLPPAVAPVQVVVLPIAPHKEGVPEAAKALKEQLAAICRVKLDDSENSAGWKFAEYEMKGVPLRVEYGPRDIEQGVCVVVRRDNRVKTVVPVTELKTRIPELLKAVHDGLYAKALTRREEMTFSAASLPELIDTA